MRDQVQIPEKPILLSRVLSDEIRRIRPELGSLPPDAELGDVIKQLHKSEMTALCLSGGGIRSATFALGITQGLAKRRLLSRVDFLSTVSGGGYLGTWLSSWIRAEQLNAYERAAVDILYEGSTEERAIAKHFTQGGKESNSFEFLDYQQKKYGLNPEIKSKADRSPDTDLKTVTKDGELAQKLVCVDETPERRAKKRCSVEEIDGKVAELMFGKHSRDQKVRDHGVHKVEADLAACLDPASSNPNPEPRPLRYLRQYSNYMTPTVGLASADTWAFIGLYLRNLFLNWTIFVPIIAAFLLLPRLLFAFVRDSKALYGSRLIVTGLFAAALLLAIKSLQYVIDQLPSKQEPRREVSQQAFINGGDGKTLLGAVLPLVMSAELMTLLWRGFSLGGGDEFMEFLGWSDGFDSVDRNYFMGFNVAVYLGAYLLYAVIRWTKGRPLITNAWSVFAALASSITGGIIFWFAVLNLGPQMKLANGFFYREEMFATFAVPIFLIVFLMQATIFVGLSSKKTPDADREWLARFGGWLLMVSLFWIGLHALVLFGPELGQKFYDLVLGIYKTGLTPGKFTEQVGSIVTALLPIATALLALIGGYSGKTSAADARVETKKARAVSIIIQAASIISLLTLLIGIHYLTVIVMSKTAIWLTQPESGHFRHTLISLSEAPLDTLPHISVVNSSTCIYVLMWVAALGTLGFVMACLLSVNNFSIHGAYRDRLIRAYLGASNSYRRPNPFTGFDEGDNRQLHRLKSQRPFHILNATLNLLHGSNLAWQKRRAASFTMTPLYCGSWPFGYRDSTRYSTTRNTVGCAGFRYCNQLEEVCSTRNSCHKEKALRLGTAMAISGAAASPNMGHYSSPVVTFLMGIFNIRLGWWLGNPGDAGGKLDAWRKFTGWIPRKPRHFFERSGPAVAMLPLINEVLGRTSEDKRYVNITDGGHFENLAIYEMALRRCRLMIVSDAAADEAFTFGEISNAIEKCRVDLGVEICFRDDLRIYGRSAKKKLKEKGQRYAIADVFYPETTLNGDRRRGYLIYMRPTLSGKEPIDIRHYAAANDSFPHQSTGDQFFDEKQFEAYRSLGILTLEEVFQSEDVKEILATLYDV